MSSKRTRYMSFKRTRDMSFERARDMPYKRTINCLLREQETYQYDAWYLLRENACCQGYKVECYTLRPRIVV